MENILENSKLGKAFHNAVRVKLAIAAVFTALFVVGGILRIFELKSAYNPTNGLFDSGSPYSIALICLGVFATLIAAFAGVAFRRREQAEHLNTAEMPLLNVLRVVFLILAIFALLVAFAGNFAAAATGVSSAAAMAIGILTLFCAVTLFLSGTNRNVSGGYYILLLVPIFWMCFILLWYFKENIANPAKLYYAYALFGYISALLMLFNSAGLKFGVKKRGWVMTFSAMTLFFSGTAAVGKLFVDISMTNQFTSLLAYIKTTDCFEVMTLAAVAFLALFNMFDTPD